MLETTKIRAGMLNTQRNERFSTIYKLLLKSKGYQKGVQKPSRRPGDYLPLGKLKYGNRSPANFCSRESPRSEGVDPKRRKID